MEMLLICFQDVNVIQEDFVISDDLMEDNLIRVNNVLEIKILVC